MGTVHFHFSIAETLFNTTVTPLPLSEEERSLIKADWQCVNAEGKFFNGAVLAGRAINFNDAPAITISTSDYAHYLYANNHPAATPCRIVYCAAAIITSDNHILIGEMNSSTASPGRLQFVAGNIEIAPDGSINGKQCCEREIKEEIGAAFLDKASGLQPLCIKTGGKADHIGLYYVLRVSITALEAEAAFNDHLAELRLAKEKPELVKAHFVELTEATITKFCNENSARFVDYLQPLLVSHRQALSR